jgi:hypothetical protein
MTTIEPTTEPKNRGGAPPNNANRLKSGRRAWAAVKRLPKGAGAVRRALYAERDELERETVSHHGEITLYHAALIQSAIRHSGRAQLLERWVRIEADLSLAERLAVLKEIGSATDSRDKCLKSMGLDAKRHADPWTALDTPQTNGWRAHHDGQHETSTTPPNALDAKPANHNGESSNV